MLVLRSKNGQYHKGVTADPMSVYSWAPIHAKLFRDEQAVWDYFKEVLDYEPGELPAGVRIEPAPSCFDEKK